MQGKIGQAESASNGTSWGWMFIDSSGLQTVVLPLLCYCQEQTRVLDRLLRPAAKSLSATRWLQCPPHAVRHRPSLTPSRSYAKPKPCMLRCCGAKQSTSLRARIEHPLGAVAPKAGLGGGQWVWPQSTHVHGANVQISSRMYCRELQWSTAQRKLGRRLPAWPQSLILVMPHWKLAPSQQSMLYSHACRDRVRRHPKQAWAAIGGVAAMLLILVVLVLKLEFRSGHGGLTASPRSACTYSGSCNCTSCHPHTSPAIHS